MKVKRIFLILMIFLIIFATLSVSSAGWFDFLGGDDNDEPDLGFIYVPAFQTMSLIIIV